MGVNGTMIPSAQLVEFIRTAEGKKLDEETGLHVAYEDHLGTNNPMTIGYGHTSAVNVEIAGVLDGKEYHGTEVVPRLLIDEEEAQRLLRIVIERKAGIVREAVQVELSQNQFDALVDMAYNLGTAPFRKGSDILAALNYGVDDNNIPIGPKDYDRAEEEFLRWGKAQGKPLQALHSRRIAAALMSRGLPHQWALYNPAITLATSLAMAEETAREMDDTPFVEMEPPESKSRVIVTAGPKPKREGPDPVYPAIEKPKKRKEYFPHGAPKLSPTGYGSIDPNAPPKEWYASRREWGRIIQLMALSGFAWPAMNQAEALAMAEIGGLLISWGIGVGVTYWGQNDATRYTK